MMTGIFLCGLIQKIETQTESKEELETFAWRVEGRSKGGLKSSTG
jgi:hypothetical protein